jgi:hypothetical protein
MKVIIYIFGEGDFKRDTLESGLVPVFAGQIKTSFENNNVPTIVLETDDVISENPKNWMELTKDMAKLSRHYNVNVFDELRKAEDKRKLLKNLPDNWRNEAKRIHNPRNVYNNGWCLCLKWCADELEFIQK